MYKFVINEKKRVVLTNFVSLVFLQGANYILPLITLPYLVIVLNMSKFGLVMFAQSVCNFFLITVNFGFELSGTREISLLRSQNKDISPVFWSITFIKIVLTVICFLILLVLTQFVDRFNDNQNIYYLSYGVVLGQAIFPTYFFMGIEHMKVITFINILAKLIFTVLIFVFIKTEFDYYLVPVFNSLGFIISGIIGFFVALKYVKVVPFQKSLVKRLFTESSRLFVGNFFTNLYTNSNTVILGFFAADFLVGIYSSMEKLFLALKSIYIPIYQAIFPMLVKQNDKKRIAVFHKIFLLVLSTGLMLAIIVFVGGDYILDVIFKKPSISNFSYIFKTFGFLGLFSGLSMAFLVLYFPSKKLYNIRMKIFILVGVSHLILSVFLVKYYNINGTLICVVISEVLLLVLSLIFYLKINPNKSFRVSI